MESRKKPIIPVKKIVMLSALFCATAMLNTAVSQNSGKAKDAYYGVQSKQPYNAPYTEEGVSAELMAEYKSITEKYSVTINGQKGYHFVIADEDRLWMADIFSRMSKKQRQGQIYKFTYENTPRIPTPEVMAQWSDANKYDITIDGKAIDNSSLARYKNTDFASYSIVPHRNSIALDEDGKVIQKDKRKATVQLITVGLFKETAKDLNLAITGKTMRTSSDGKPIVFF